MKPSEVIGRAAVMSADQCRRLAALEWRSRTAAWDDYIKAGMELDDKITMREFVSGRDAVERALAGVRGQLDVEADTLAVQSIQQAAYCALLGERLSREARMFLGRAWRAFLKEDAETS